MSEKIKIAIICGGLSNERDVSLKSGKQVFDHLPGDNYEKFLVEITQDGVWLLDGKPLTIMHPEQGIGANDLKKFDILFLALHGKFGEDGKIQSILDVLGVPYTGSGVLASALGMNKAKTLEFAASVGIKVPKFLSLADRQNINLQKIDELIKSKMGYPCVIKPNESGSSIGVSIAKSVEDLKKAINAAYAEDDQILIEEFIKGQEITCGVMGNANQDLAVLPPAEVIAANEFFDYDAKYFSEKTQEICPAEISAELTAEAQNLAKKLHKALGCDGLTRTDFILKDDIFYLLEINTLPGLTEQSLCPKEARAAGISFAEFLDRQVKLAIEKNKIVR